MALRVNLLPLSQVMKANFVYYYDDVCIVYFVFYLQKKSIPMNVIIILFIRLHTINWGLYSETLGLVHVCLSLVYFFFFIAWLAIPLENK